MTQSGGSAFTYNVTLDGTGFSAVTPVILKYNNPTTTQHAASVFSTSYTATGLTSFSDFGLGDGADDVGSAFSGTVFKFQ